MFPHEERRSRLIGSVSDTIDAFLVTSLVNLRYLTGFSGSNGAALVGPAGASVLAVDGRYLTQAAAEAPGMALLDARAVAPALVQHAVGHGVRRLGIEPGHVTIALWEMLQATAGDRIELVPVPQAVERLRAVKDAGEVELLRRACEITDAAFAAVVDDLREGVTESEVAWRLELAIRAAGGDGPAFASIVAFGSNSAIPHHQPTGRELRRGELVKIDFGARLHGYHADMTRTVVLGPAADWQRELHGQVQQIQSASRAACVVGGVPAELDEQAAAAIRRFGHGVAHGLGHGVGLAIHEEPFLTPGSPAGPLTAQMTVTIEPGIYLVDRGGVRIEDTMLVTADGAVPLTTSSRDLLEVSMS